MAGVGRRTSALADPEHPHDHHNLHTHFATTSPEALSPPVSPELSAQVSLPGPHHGHHAGHSVTPQPSSRQHSHRLLPHFHPHIPHIPHFHPNIFKPHHHDEAQVETTIGTPTTVLSHSHRSHGSSEHGAPRPQKEPPCCPAKMVIFTVNLLLGLFLSQLIPEQLGGHPVALRAWKSTIKVITMWCLAYIMVHVGYEFDIDKSRLRSYAKDYAVGMTAAGVPWLAVAAWFIFALPEPLGWQEALVAARFAAPTSAGILFAMLEAAGLKETWLFRKVCLFMCMCMCMCMRQGMCMCMCKRRACACA